MYVIRYTNCNSSRSSRLSLSSEAQFPAITVVRASEWLDAGSPSEDDFSEADTNTLISQVDLPKGAIRQYVSFLYSTK